jgi:hypothetical protein
MAKLYHTKKETSFIKIAFVLCIFVFIPLIFSCDSKRDINEPEFKVLEFKLAKGIDDSGGKDVVLNPTDTFSSVDTAAVAYVSFANLSGKHNLRWKWYSPDGMLYYKTGNTVLNVPKGQYASDASAWHKISIVGDRAQHYPGQWKVELHFDNSLISSKYFNLQTDLSDIAFDVDVNIPKTSMDKPNAVAVVIGNRHYQHKDIPEVKFAINDASVVKKYLIQILGYRDKNVIFETDITKTRFEILFGILGDHQGILNDYVKAGVSEVFIYYSGHGAPDINNSKGYFVPSDCDPSKVAITGYPLDVFYQNIAKIKAIKMTIVLEACFSGGTNSGDWLIREASPALIKVEQPLPPNENMIVMTSSAGDQISSWHPEREHGLFTYFFLKAMRGYGDTNKDNKMSIQEIYDCVSDQSEGVPYWARRFHGGRVQTPTLQGSGADIFSTF